MSVIQACIPRGFLLHSNMSRRISLRVLYYHMNNNRPAKIHATLHRRLLEYLDNVIMQPNKNSELTTASHSIIRAENKIKQDADVDRKIPQYYVANKSDEQSLHTGQDSGSVNLPLILDRIYDLKRVHGFRERQTVLYKMDEEISRVLDILSSEQLLLILNRMMVVIPEMLAILQTYKNGMAKLRQMISEGSIKPREMVNFLLIASLPKRADARTVSFIMKHMPELKSFSIIEQAIVSLATFKAGIKLDRESVWALEDTIQSNLDYLIEDPGLFISLLKALRLGKPSPEFNLNLLSKKILDKKSPFTVSLAIPVLGLYADILKPKYSVLKRLVEDCIAEMIEQRENSKGKKSSDPIRCKDVNRLLWTICKLNYRITRGQLREMEDYVKDNSIQLLNHRKEFCGILFSLWTLKSPKHREMVEYCFKEKILEPLLGEQDAEEKLNMLIDCIRIESPEITIPPNFLRPTIPKSMKDCNELEAVTELIKCLEPHLNLYDTQMHCPVESIRIYGVSAKHEKLGLLHIDLLNNVTCLKDTTKPHGVMRLKLRLVKAMGYSSILLHNPGVIKLESMIDTIEKYINSKLAKLRN